MDNDKIQQSLWFRLVIKSIYIIHKLQLLYCITINSSRYHTHGPWSRRKDTVQFHILMLKLLMLWWFASVLSVCRKMRAWYGHLCCWLYKQSSFSLCVQIMDRRRAYSWLVFVLGYGNMVPLSAAGSIVIFLFFDFYFMDKKKKLIGISIRVMVRAKDCVWCHAWWWMWANETYYYVLRN